MASRGSFGSYGDSSSYSSYHAGAPASGSANEFTRLTQVIGSNMQKISQNVSQMQRHVNQIGTPQDTPDLRDKLHQVQHYTNQLAKDTNKYLKDLSQLPNPSNQSEQRQRKMQKARLAEDFGAALNNFQAAQRSAAQKEKESVARARASSGAGYDPFSDDRRGDDQLVGFETQQQTSLQMEQDVDLTLLREREQAIKKLEGDIVDVNQIFKDLGMLVHDQGEIVDSIEANVESAQIHVSQGSELLQKAKEQQLWFTDSIEANVEDAAIHVVEANEQLHQARTYQSKARRKKCIILIVVIVVLAILALILGLTIKKN